MPPRAARSHSASVGNRKRCPAAPLSHSQYATASNHETATTGCSGLEKFGSLQCGGCAWPVAQRGIARIPHASPGIRPTKIHPATRDAPGARCPGPFRCPSEKIRAGILAMRGCVMSGSCTRAPSGETAPSSFRLRVACLADQVDEQAEGSRHAGGQLPEERKSRVDVNALAVPRIHQAAVRLGLAAVFQAEHRLVGRAERAPEVEAALLDPALEIGRRDFVRRIQQRIFRMRESARANSDRSRASPGPPFLPETARAAVCSTGNRAGIPPRACRRFSRNRAAANSSAADRCAVRTRECPPGSRRSRLKSPNATATSSSMST